MTRDEMLDAVERSGQLGACSEDERFVEHQFHSHLPDGRELHLMVWREPHGWWAYVSMRRWMFQGIINPTPQVISMANTLRTCYPTPREALLVALGSHIEAYEFDLSAFFTEVQ